jgi:RNA-directed DNA polymerase
MVKHRTRRKEEEEQMSSDMHNPDKGSTEKTGRLSGYPASTEGMMERIVARGNVLRAWKQVKRNHGAPGVDGMTCEEFPTYARTRWATIRQDLLDGKYRPSPLLRVEIPKRSGGKRLLGIPTVIDRVIQQAIAQVLTPIFDPGFSESSFGFRPGRSARDAVRRVREHISGGYSTAIEVDLAKYFDEVNHDVLMVRVAKKVRDKRVLKLIGAYLRAGVLVDKAVEPTTKGVPQGGPLSPLLANIVLDDFDKELERRGHRFARYADDFVILVKSPRAGERVKQSVARFLEKKLKLKINRAKSKVGKANQAKFLGFTFPGKTIRWTTEAIEDFKHRIRKLTARSWSVSMDDRIARLNEYIRGWLEYYGISEYWTPIEPLDQWIRRRLRMCLWKQWRYVKTKVTNLAKLGADVKAIIRLAFRNRGPWWCSDAREVQFVLHNNYFHQQLGLISIRELWIQVHYPS